MRNLPARLRAFLADEAGPTSIEYALMLALLIGACAQAVATVGTRCSQFFSTANQGWTGR